LCTDGFGVDKLLQEGKILQGDKNEHHIYYFNKYSYRVRLIFNCYGYFRYGKKWNPQGYARTIEKTMSKDPLLALLGSLIIGCAVSLFFMQQEYKLYAEPFMHILAVAGFLISVWAIFNSNSRD
jgi:hypothetical protein